MKLTKEALLSTLPVVLAEDPEMSRLASVIAGAIADRIPEIDLARIYPRIDELPEALCDILAYDFKADWWEYDAPLEEKRETLKRLWYVHRHKGTKGAVERAVGAVFPGSAASEWFEYGGEPYHFRMDIRVGEGRIGEDTAKRIRWLISYFKNLRSVLESLTFTADMGETSVPVHSRMGNGRMLTELPDLFRNMDAELMLRILFLSGTASRTSMPDVTPEERGEIPYFFIDELGQQLIDENRDWLADEAPAQRPGPVRVYLTDELGQQLIDEQFRWLVDLQPVERSAQGSTVCIPDALGLPLKSLVVGIEPVQDLHGFKNPWTPGGGKNIADLKETTVPVSSQSITISGTEGNLTFTSTGNYGRAGYFFPTKTGETYTISFTYNKTQAHVFSTVYLSNSFEGTWKYDTGRISLGNQVISDTYVSQTIVATSDTLFVGFYVSAGTSYPDTITIKNFQIELGSAATSYAPYANICPITGWTGVNIHVSPTGDPEDGRTYAVTFPSEAGTVYGGTLDVTSGVLTVDRIIFERNTSTMNNSESYPGWRESGIRDVVGANVNSYIEGVIGNIGNRVSVNTNGANDIVFLSEYTYGKTQSEWITLAMDVQFVIPLNDPITYHLTPTEIETLIGENNVWADTGDVEVRYETDA